MQAESERTVDVTGGDGPFVGRHARSRSSRRAVIACAPARAAPAASSSSPPICVLQVVRRQYLASSRSGSARFPAADPRRDCPRSWGGDAHSRSCSVAAISTETSPNGTATSTAPCPMQNWMASSTRSPTGYRNSTSRPLGTSRNSSTWQRCDPRTNSQNRSTHSLPPQGFNSAATSNTTSANGSANYPTTPPKAVGHESENALSAASTHTRLKWLQPWVWIAD